MNTIHYLNLNPVPFALIKTKAKKVEMRLFDERRKVLKVDDYIVFTNNESQEQIKTKIVGLRTFKSFKELYLFYEKSLLGYRKDEEADHNDMLQYYSIEKIEQYGALAIEIELINF